MSNSLPRPVLADAIAVAGFSVGYDGVRILDNLNFHIQPGEAVALLGRNGAGKSTLASALFAMDVERHGQLVIKGQDVSAWPSHRIARLGIALVPQGRGVFGELTIEQNLDMAALWSRRQPTRRWVKARIYDEFPRLAERRAFQSGALSGGERQLLAIARALLTQADIIVLDEPSEGLSPRAIEEIIMGTIGRLRQEGHTLLIAEQNIDMATRLAERALVLDHGGIAYDGSAKALLADAGLQRQYLGL